MAPNNNDIDYTLVRNKANEIDMDIAGELQNFHVFSLRQWVMSIKRPAVFPQTTEEWEEYFWGGQWDGKTVFVVRNGEAYGLGVDGDMGADNWTANEFDRTYITIPDDVLDMMLG